MMSAHPRCEVDTALLTCAEVWAASGRYGRITRPKAGRQAALPEKRRADEWQLGAWETCTQGDRAADGTFRCTCKFAAPGSSLQSLTTAPPPEGIMNHSFSSIHSHLAFSRRSCSQTLQ